MPDKMTRIAVINEDKCKPKKCRQECKKSCPVVRTGKLCIEVTPASKLAFISERLCVGCGICIKKCPFGAINIINLPTNMDTGITHRYSANSFKFHGLPEPTPGQVLGLIGVNGIGKSTALKILSGTLKCNLGRYDDPPDYQEILKYFQGGGLFNYFKDMLEERLRTVTKPQYVDTLAKVVQGTGEARQVGTLLNGIKMEEMKILGRQIQASIEAAKDPKNSKDSTFQGGPEHRAKLEQVKNTMPEALEKLIDVLELRHVLSRDIDQLSGGELQRYAIAIACLRWADVHMFDEPSSFLDIKQRLAASRTIHELTKHNKRVIVVEHDLAVLDYLSDNICIMYGKPGVYGVVALPAPVRDAINMFLKGTFKTQNIRIRDNELTFRMAEAGDEQKYDKARSYSYPSMEKTLGGFRLSIEAGEFTDSEIIVMMGENGTGKTTFCKLLAGKGKPDGQAKVPGMHVSMKPQTLTATFTGTVRQLLFKKIKAAFLSPQFQTDVYKPLQIDDFIDQEVKHLSGGELQRVAIVLALGAPADLYLIDEPSAYLDTEQRLIAAKVIKRFIMHAKKTAFIVEHDFIMATYLADRVIVFNGQPGVEARANAPEGLLTGCNSFLKNLDVTFRRDPDSFRPRINKYQSQMDQEQKLAGNYFFLEESS